MKIVILLYDGFTALDAIGPYEVLSRLPGAELTFAAARAGVVTSDTGFLKITATRGIDEIDAGRHRAGAGRSRRRRRCMQHAPTLEWLRRMHEQHHVDDVGLHRLAHPRGRRTAARACAPRRTGRRSRSSGRYGAEPVKARAVESGKIVTAAGVSAGIDMALRLVQRIAGDDLARGIQLGIEYDPDPPFDAGSPEKLPPEFVELLRGVLAGARAERAKKTAA